MNKGLVITSVVTFVLLFLLILSVFMFCLFPVSFNVDDSSYYFNIDIAGISLYHYDDYSDIGTYAFNYIDYQGKKCVYLYLNSTLLTDKYYQFELSHPYFFIIYDISNYDDINDSYSLRQYILNGGFVDLDDDKILYCSLVPSYMLPYWYEDGSILGAKKDFILSYYNEHNEMPTLYEVLSFNYPVQLLYDGSNYTITYLQFNMPLRFEVGLSSYNIFSSSLFTFTEFIQIIDFPTFVFRFNSIFDIGYLANSLIKYLGDVIYYFQSLFSALFYSFMPFLWLN